MRQPTMYSYMASHRYLYQIVFTHTSLSASEHIVTLQFIPNEPDLTQLFAIAGIAW